MAKISPLSKIEIVGDRASDCASFLDQLFAQLVPALRRDAAVGGDERALVIATDAASAKAVLARGTDRVVLVNGDDKRLRACLGDRRHRLFQICAEDSGPILGDLAAVGHGACFREGEVILSTPADFEVLPFARSASRALTRRFDLLAAALAARLTGADLPALSDALLELARSVPVEPFHGNGNRRAARGR